jgi:hypothetical protein
MKMSETQPTERETAIKLLLSEKEHADRQIAGYLELQLKLLAFLFGAGGAVLGLAFAKLSDRPTHSELGYIAAFLSIAASVVSLQSVITYGIALGYIRYKQHDVMPTLRSLCGLEPNTLNAVSAFTSGPAGTPVFFATVALSALHLAASVGLLLLAVAMINRSSAKTATVTLAILALIAALVGDLLLGSAMKRVGDGQ